jgi:site-specific recombinase XerD
VFSDIDLNFIKAYDTFIITKTDNCDNTRFKALSVFKSLINRAIRNGHIKENPFKDFPISKKSGKREFLSMEEISLLEELRQKPLPNTISNVLQYFLFACYTGLRYQDIKDLKFKDIDNDMVSIIMHKTKERVTIPLSIRAKNLLYPGLQNQKIFRVYVNQVTNRYLKEISKLSGINKEISFHCARHTFATIGISLNIPIEVISKLLGHTDLKTTQIYAKVMNDVKIKQMEKWDTW